MRKTYPVEFSAYEEPKDYITICQDGQSYTIAVKKIHISCYTHEETCIKKNQ